MKIDDSGKLHPGSFCQNSNVSRGVEPCVSLVAFPDRLRALTDSLIADAEAFASLRDPSHPTPPAGFLSLGSSCSSPPAVSSPCKEAGWCCGAQRKQEQLRGKHKLLSALGANASKLWSGRTEQVCVFVPYVFELLGRCK